MAYTALYRKYRPNTFLAMVGQEAVVKTLKNQLKSGKVSHAYLFCGTRGTGKTSAAKIFARTINCLHNKDGEPCNECERCQAVLSGRSFNVTEIDAASNNGVDNIREIREEVKYPPAEGGYKVYIIDEVHMLSSGAFNALLKTLEEPPAHVIFILATTDPQKVPVTILSRCQRFDFKRIPSSQIVLALKKYLENEEASISEEGLSIIARLSDGSMRDALSLLDQAMAYYGEEEITGEKIRNMVGAVDDSVFFAMTENLSLENAKGLMETIEEMINDGRDVQQFVSGLLGHLRNLLVVASVPKPEDILDISTDSILRLQEQSKKLSQLQIMYFMREFSALLGDLKYAQNPRILLEVAALKLAAPPIGRDIESLLVRISGLEKKVAEGISAVPQEPKAKVANKPVKKKAVPALSEDRKAAVDAWPAMCREFEPVLRGKLSAVKLGFKEDDDERLYLICSYDMLGSMLQNDMEEISKKLTAYLEKTFTLAIISQSEYDKWYYSNFEQSEETKEDNEFQSIMNNYFEEADYRE